jgi:Fe-S cluster assembly protein SufD
VTAMTTGAPAAASAALAPYRARLRQVLAEHPGPAWLREAREAAMARAELRGFPGPHDEAWRFTPVTAIARATFDGGRHGLADARALQGLSLGADVSAELVFVDGRFSPELSRTAAGAVRVQSLSEALESAPASLQPHLFRVAAEDSVFGDLNAALATDGAVVSVAEKAVVGSPIHVLYVSTASGGGAPAMSHVRTLVLAGRASQSTVVQTWAGLGSSTYLSTAVTEVLLEDGAIVDHYRMQQEGGGGLHVSSLHVRQGRGSRFVDHGLFLGAALSRNDATVLLDGEGAECVLDGLFMAAGTQHVDAHTVIDHLRPQCTSRELYNGVLDGKGRGVFHGRIVVRPDAQKTSAHQANHNLLLSREALVNSTPALEIRADDVKCKHGSTTGQIDAQSLFYLRSRGIGEEAARAMLVYAFAAEVIGRVAVPSVRARLHGLLAGRLDGAPTMEALA